MSEISEDLYEAITPGQVRVQEDEVDEDTEVLCESIAVCLDQWWQILGVQWDNILSAEETPTEAIRYAAQFSGLQVETQWTEETQRTMLAAPPGFARGTVAAMVSAIQMTLTGSKTVYLVERPDGEAYQLIIRTLEGETPSPEMTEAAIRAVKPAGIMLDYDVLTGQTYNLIDVSYTTYQEVDDAYDSYDEMRSDIEL